MPLPTPLTPKKQALQSRQSAAATTAIPERLSSSSSSLGRITAGRRSIAVLWVVAAAGCSLLIGMALPANSQTLSGCYTAAAVTEADGSPSDPVSSLAACVSACPDAPYIGLSLVGKSTTSATCTCVESVSFFPNTIQCGICFGGAATCGDSDKYYAVYSKGVSKTSTTSDRTGPGSSLELSSSSTGTSALSASSTQSDTATSASTTSSNPAVTSKVVVTLTSDSDAGGGGAQTAAKTTSSKVSAANAPIATAPGQSDSTGSSVQPTLIGIIAGIAAAIIAAFVAAWVFVVNPRRKAQREKMQQLDDLWSPGAGAGAGAAVGARSASAASVRRAESASQRAQSTDPGASSYPRGATAPRPVAASTPMGLEQNTAVQSDVNDAAIAAAAAAHAHAAAAAAVASAYTPATMYGGPYYQPQYPPGVAVDPYYAAAAYDPSQYNPATAAQYYAAAGYDPSAAAAAAHAAAHAHATAAAMQAAYSSQPVPLPGSHYEAVTTTGEQPVADAVERSPTSPIA
ncbi:hypothetical protein DFJ73DRAFT_847557 [Zopfochytrium polystomum]|nr:hypothetical protein DFJ73DRAFT_847557 [Zopfochytrium polystomum]